MENGKQKSGAKHAVELTNLDKILFPKDKITKGDVVAYYRKIAPYMLPHVKGRCITMHRFPDGIQNQGFYQQEVGEYFPKWVSRKRVKKQGGSVVHPVINTARDLTYLANQAVITPHAWLSRTDRPQYPDRMIFDLDPPGDNAALARRGARELKKVLDELGLPSFVMTTGSAGFHVVVPLKRTERFDAVRARARSIAEELARRHPKAFTVEQRKNKRRGRLFIDYLRNAYAQTGVAPYAILGRDRAPVAAPIRWSELSRTAPRTYTIKNIFRRIRERGDPWKGFGQ